ncbi:TPA: Cro/CI family transcriptional regulator [Aeromonas hydrophila]
MKTNHAVKYFGSKAALARALGINKGAVSQWGEKVPKGRAYQLELMTGGQLKADPTQSRPTQ